MEGYSVREHDLKTWPKHFQAVYDGDKPFELRYNDRGFKVGDVLLLREWRPRLDYARSFQGSYTGRAVRARVTYILDEYEELPEFVADNFVIMGIRLIGRREFKEGEDEADSTTGTWVAV